MGYTGQLLSNGNRMEAVIGYCRWVTTVGDRPTPLCPRGWIGERGRERESRRYADEHFSCPVYG
jgi:hypothetical protein